MGARCNLGTWLEKFLSSKCGRGTPLCRETKTAEEAVKSTRIHEKRIYGALQIKTRPLSNICGQGVADLKGDAGPIKIVGESERRIGNATIAISQTSPWNTDNDAQYDLLHATSVGHYKRKRLSRGVEIFDGEHSPSDEVSSQKAISVRFVKRKHRWSSESSDDYMLMAKRRKRKNPPKDCRTKVKSQE